MKILRNNTLEKENYREQIALFRFSLIAPLVNDTYSESSKSEYCRNIAAKKHKLPSGIETTVASKTIIYWYHLYNRLGYDALKPKSRNDAGISRKIPTLFVDKVLDLKKQMPHITGKKIYEKLIEDGDIKASEVSLATIYRFLNNNKLHDSNALERKAFEMQFANDCWQGDTSHGPIITIDSKKVQTYLIQIIDDASRVIVGYDFFLRDNAINFQLVLKNAIKIYGIPKKIFVDNGTPYKNTQLFSICASLGIELIHAKAYSPESKAKIERSFRTVKDNFINCTNWNNFTSLDELKSAYSEYINTCYNSVLHSGINDIPRNRYNKDIDKIRFIGDSHTLDTSFLHMDEKTVTSCATIRLFKKDFEVPAKYIKQRILIKYNPLDDSCAYIYDTNTSKIETIYPVDKIANSKIKRKPLCFSDDY